MIQRFLLLAVWLVPTFVFAQSSNEGSIIFKDGFTIQGKVLQPKTQEFDPTSGASFAVPLGSTYLDDNVRRIYFPPAQIAEIIKKPREQGPEVITLMRTPITPKPPTKLPAWHFESVPPFDKVWERHVKVGLGNVVPQPPPFSMHQRIVMLTPQRMYIQSLTHGWDMHYLTKELGFDELTKLITDYLDTKKETKDLPADEKQFVLANFYHQMGNFDASEKLTKDLLGKVPMSQQKKVQELLDAIDVDRARKFAREFEPLAEGKQHRTLIDRLAAYDRDNMIAKVPEKTKLLAQDLKNKYVSDNDKLDKVKSLFAYLKTKDPEPKTFWAATVDTILKELNYDTVARLETFQTFAEQYRRDADKGIKPSQTVENVLALAVTGWHLGNIAAEPDVKLAQNLWKGRLLMPEYMKADTVGRRTQIVDAFLSDTRLPIDVVARLIQHLPPPNAYEKLSGEVMLLDFDLPDAPAGQYLILLPPDYHHMRPHPVLVLMHGREAPKILMERWQSLAAQYGFILVAPNWTKGLKTGYTFSEAEQTYQMNVLRDLKRRFAVDTDRVFIFGWALGGDIAWDTALGHPDQFAGLLAMCGTPEPLMVKKHWANAQNLGIYAVDGDKSGNGPVVVREMMKDFIRCNYNAYYLEYKGRANELYTAEFEPMMDWMSRKKRRYPTRSLGNYSTSGAYAEEFRSFRQCDNRFYWISSDEIAENHTQDYSNWVKGRTPAMFQGNITVANEADTKGNARITTNIALRVQGLKQVNVWLSPSMVDFTKPVQMRVNGKTVGPLRTLVPSIHMMLEDYFSNVDRQRLYYAKIEMKL